MSAKEKSRAREKRHASKISRARKKQHAPANTVALEKKGRAKGKKVFAIEKKGYIPNMMLYSRMYGTNRAQGYVQLISSQRFYGRLKLCFLLPLLSIVRSGSGF